MTDVRLLATVAEAVSIVVGADIRSIGEDTDLLELGLDSLGFSSLIVEIEAICERQIPDEVLAGLDEDTVVATVGDVCEWLSGVGLVGPALDPT